MIRTLLFSTLYPNAAMPSHGVFVETRLRQLLAAGGVGTRVVAPVPWFPFSHPVFGEYARFAAVPAREERNGLQIEHPRYVLLPKVGMNLTPYTLARSGLAAVRRLMAEGYDFDLIDAHYFYPDGVAASMIGKALGKPVTITARGTDINLIPEYAKPRRMILDAVRDCGAVITVSAALRDVLIRLGASKDITVLRNGVDLELFFPEEQQAARAALGVSGYVVASVGNLVSNKGHDLAIRALARISDAQLLIAGRGVEEAALRTLVAGLGLGNRVRFLGVLPQEALRSLYSASDCLVLASSREGWPNVLTEALACGTPVVASNVGGVPEIVTCREAGVLLGELSEEAIVRAIGQLRAAPPAREATRAYAEAFGWDATTAGQLSLFGRVLEQASA